MLSSVHSNLTILYVRTCIPYLDEEGEEEIDDALKEEVDADNADTRPVHTQRVVDKPGATSLTDPTKHTEKGGRGGRGERGGGRGERGRE